MTPRIALTIPLFLVLVALSLALPYALVELPGISSLPEKEGAAVGILASEITCALGGWGLLHLLGYRFSEASPLRSTRFWLVVALGCLAVPLSDEIVGRIGDLVEGAGYAAGSQEEHADSILSSPLWHTFFSINVLGPIFEEITFRGLLLKYVFTRHAVIGVVASTLLFAFIHSPATAVDWLYYVIPGAIFAVAYYATRRLEASILIHALTNLYVYASVLVAG